MTEQRIEFLRTYAQGCDMFASLLLDLPDEGMVEKIMQTGLEAEADPSAADSEAEADKGSLLIAAYSKSCVDREAGEVLQEISVDRTRLLCGLTMNGPKPPYESLFTGAVANDVALSVMDSYRAGNCSIAEQIKDAPDHLGIEISFVSELCKREAAALEQGDEDTAKEAQQISSAFMADHLGLWAAAFADEMFANATTDFYRGVALLLKSFVDDGKSLLSA